MPYWFVDIDYMRRVKFSFHTLLLPSTWSSISIHMYCYDVLLLCLVIGFFLFLLPLFIFWTFYFFGDATVYSLCCRRLCISSFGAFPVLLISRPIPDFYAKIPDFYAAIMCYLGFYAQYRAWCAVGGAVGRGRGGSFGWLGAVLSLVRVFSQAYSLTCQPDSRFCIPSRILFP